MIYNRQNGEVYPLSFMPTLLVCVMAAAPAITAQSSETFEVASIKLWDSLNPGCAPQILDIVQKYNIGNGSRTVREYAPKNLNAVLADHKCLMCHACRCDVYETDKTSRE